MNDIFEDALAATNNSDSPRRFAPPGKYLASVADYKKVENPNNGNQGVELYLNLLESLGDQDMTGVDLSRATIKNTVWVTQRSQAVARDLVFDRIVPENRGQDFKHGRDLFESLVGRNVVVECLPDPVVKNGREVVYLKIGSYEQAPNA